MIVLLEGVDGSGKSTLAFDIAAELKRRYPNDKVHYEHAGPLKIDPDEAYAWPFAMYSPMSGEHYVCDRWHVGELIYGPLYRGKSAIDAEDLWFIEHYLDARGAALVHVTQALDVIRARLEARGEDFLQPEHVEQVWEAFTEKTEQSSLYAITAVPDGDNAELVTQIIDAAAAREAEADLAWQN